VLYILRDLQSTVTKLRNELNQKEGSERKHITHHHQKHPSISFKDNRLIYHL